MSIFDLENRLPLLKRTATLSLKLPKVTTLCPPIPTTPPGHHSVPTYIPTTPSRHLRPVRAGLAGEGKKKWFWLFQRRREVVTPPLLLSLTLHSHTHGGSEKVGSQHLIKQSSPGWNDVLFQNPPRAERIFFSLIFVKKLSVVHYNSWGLNLLIILQYLYYLLRYGYFVFSVFFTVYSYLMTNFCKFCIEHSLWPFELRSVGIFKISLTVYEI